MGEWEYGGHKKRVRIVWVIGWIIRKDFVRVIHRIRKEKTARLRVQSVLKARRTTQSWVSGCLCVLTLCVDEIYSS